MLIAIQYYQAGETAQAIAATGGSLGLMLGPPVVALTQRCRWRVNHALAGFQFLMAALLLVAALVPSLPVYVGCGLLALVASAACIPLETQFFQQNYPAERRGHLFSIASTIRLGWAALQPRSSTKRVRKSRASRRWRARVRSRGMGEKNEG